MKTLYLETLNTYRMSKTKPQPHKRDMINKYIQIYG